MGAISLGLGLLVAPRGASTRVTGTYTPTLIATHGLTDLTDEADGVPALHAAHLTLHWPALGVWLGSTLTWWKPLRAIGSKQQCVFVRVKYEREPLGAIRSHWEPLAVV